MLHGIDDLVSVVLCNPCIDVQSLQGVIQFQRTVTLEFSLVSERQGLSKLRPSTLLQTAVKDHVWALLHLGSFELIRKAQEFGNLCSKAAKVNVGCEVVRTERVPRSGVVKLVICVAPLQYGAWQLRRDAMSMKTRRLGCKWASRDN